MLTQSSSKQPSSVDLQTLIESLSKRGSPPAKSAFYLSSKDPRHLESTRSYFTFAHVAFLERSIVIIGA